jgi:hypothetical protein
MRIRLFLPGRFPTERLSRSEFSTLLPSTRPGEIAVFAGKLSELPASECLGDPARNISKAGKSFLNGVFMSVLPNGMELAKSGSAQRRRKGDCFLVGVPPSCCGASDVRGSRRHRRGLAGAFKGCG